jgi:hypothetical protein
MYGSTSPLQVPEPPDIVADPAVSEPVAVLKSEDGFNGGPGSLYGGPAFGPTRNLSRLIPLAAAIALAIGLVSFLAFGSGDQSSDVDPRLSIDGFLTRDPDRAATELPWIQVQGPDGLRSFDNGGVITLANSIDMSVELSPFPPSTLALDMDLYLTDVGGNPLRNATVAADWDMSLMPHGVATTEFHTNGDGHYTATFDPSMFGPWVFAIRVVAPGYERSQDVSISINLWPERKT